MQLPTRALCPECLRDVMQALSPDNYRTLLTVVRKEACDTDLNVVFERFPPSDMAQELMDTWGQGHRAFMRVADLSPAWTSILKLQILLQARLLPFPFCSCQRFIGVFVTVDQRFIGFFVTVELFIVTVVFSRDRSVE